MGPEAHLFPLQRQLLVHQNPHQLRDGQGVGGVPLSWMKSPGGVGGWRTVRINLAPRLWSLSAP